MGRHSSPGISTCFTGANLYSLPSTCEFLWHLYLTVSDSWPTFWAASLMDENLIHLHDPKGLIITGLATLDPALPLEGVGSIGVAHILWVTYPFQVINLIVAAIAVKVIHQPGCITGRRLQKSMSNQSVYQELPATNLNLIIATWFQTPVRDSAATVSAPPQWTHLPTARISSFQTFRW